MSQSTLDYGQIQSFLESRLSLKLLILFGSFASGDANESSDVDLAFLTTAPIDSVSRWEMAQELAILLNKDVDLVDLATTNDVFRFQIVSTGRVLFQQNDMDRYLDQVYLTYLQLNDDRAEVLKYYGR